MIKKDAYINCKYIEKCIYIRARLEFICHRFSHDLNFQLHLSL